MECKREYKKNIRFTFDPDHHIFLLQTHQIIISALIPIVWISGSFKPEKLAAVFCIFHSLELLFPKWLLVKYAESLEF